MRLIYEFLIESIRRTRYGKGKVQGHRRRSRYSLRRTYPQGINQRLRISLEIYTAVTHLNQPKTIHRLKISMKKKMFIICF